MDALAVRDVELIDALQGVGNIGVGLRPQSAQTIDVERCPKNIGVVVAHERKAGERQIALPGAHKREVGAGFAHRAAGGVIEHFELRRSRLAPAVAAVDESGEPFAVQHLLVGAGNVLQLLERPDAGVGNRQCLVRAENVVERRRGQELIRAARRGAAVIDAPEHVERLLDDIDDQCGCAGLVRGWPQAGAEFQPRQIVRQQQIALQRPDIRRPVGDDPGGVIGKEIAIAREFLRPYDLVDPALDHLDADVGAFRIELLRRNDRARQHVAVAAVFGGDPAGDLVDGLERRRLREQVGVERPQRIRAVDGRADDVHAADDDPDFLGAGRGFGARKPDARSAWLRARHRRLRRDLFAFTTGLCAGRNDLRQRNGRYENDRRQ